MRRAWIFSLVMVVTGGCADDDSQAAAGNTTGPGAALTTSSSTHDPDGTSTGSLTDTGSPTGSGSGESDGTTSGGLDGTSTGAEVCEPIIAEVLYTVGGESDELQWLKLYNPCGVAIDLSEYTLGWAGADYVFDRRLPLALAETIPPQGCYTLGGPVSDATNGEPRLQLAEDLGPDLRDGLAQAAGVALFHLVEDAVGPDSVPIDAVVYGADNLADLIDASGQPVKNPVLGHEAGASLQRLSLAPGDWMPMVPPQPNVCPTLR